MRDHKSELKLWNQVNHMYQRDALRPGQICDWPVVGGHYVSGEEPIELRRENMEEAVRGLKAREEFARIGPPDCQPLPLSYEEIEGRRWHGHGLRTGHHGDDLLSHIVAEFACILRSHGWDFNSCPSFEDFARGMMATKLLRKLAASHFKRGEMLRLKKRYPPRPLKGLSDQGCFDWRPPKRHAKRMARAPVRQDDLRPWINRG